VYFIEEGFGVQQSPTSSMKLDKSIVQRRIDLMAAEGVVRLVRSVFKGQANISASQVFVPNAHIGVDTDIHQIRADNDAVVLCTGATWPRDLKIPGRDADGIHFAMEYLQVSLLCSCVSCGIS
jgi:glutamate synthase (NADPH/NADH)